ncbi:MAG: hypothetical protein Q8K99_10725 [Actinomycetota bacterium]|nr:hypothetical protein [Actinomycetota bacterium]
MIARGHGPLTEDITTGTDAELVRVLLSARSSTEANLAFILLRESMPEEPVVLLANLREMLSELPSPPFAAGTELSILERVLDYEHTGHSYRCEFESGKGFFGLEFVGDGNRVDAVVLHAPGYRTELHGRDEDMLDRGALDLLLKHDALADRLIEALHTLGLSFSPKFYLNACDYVLENGASIAAGLDVLF